MKSTLKYALILALGATLALPAVAQDNFPDTPDGHWASEALSNLKREGVLVGYPDGLYRGPRPMSRYEVAVALNALWMKMKGAMDGMDAQMKALQEKIDGMASPDDLKALRDQLAALQSQVDGMKGWGDAVKTLQEGAARFEKDLAALGVDVDGMKKDLADLTKRVEALEKRKPAVDIHGDANLLVLGGYGTDGSFGMTNTGRLTGVGRGSYAGQSVGANRDLSILHEAAFRFTGTNDEGPQWQATLVAGNMLTGGAFGTQSSQNLGAGFSDTGSGDVYFQDFKVMFDTSLAGLPFNATIGRQGYMINKYLYKRTDYTEAFDNERWDSGEWTMDGALLKFSFGKTQLHAWAGRNSDRNSTNGTDLNPMMSGVMVDQSMGVRLNIPVGDMGSLDLAYLWLDSNTVLAAPARNRTAVYGADLNLKFSNFTVGVGYNKSDQMYNTDTQIDSDNAAWFAKANYDGGNWGLYAGYERVEENYVAPGSWGRFGIWHNPNDVEGVMAGLWLNVSPQFKLSAKGKFYTGVSNATEDNNYNSIIAQADFQLNSNWSVMASYEDVVFDLPVVADPKQRWFTLGLGYNLSNNSMLKIRWQHSDLDNMNNFGFGIPGGQNRYRGGLISTQLSIRF